MTKRKLNEKKLLSSNPKEYMCKEQLQYFKNRLYSDKKTALEELEKIKKELCNTEQSSDPYDQAADEEARNINLRSIERLTKLVHKIEKAIINIEHGEYGYCEITGEKIGIPRLLARPFTSLCIAAKEAKEYIAGREGEG